MVSDGRRIRRTEIELLLDTPGTLKLEGPLAAMSITFPGTVVTYPNRETISIGPDVSIRCKHLRVDAESVQVLRRARAEGDQEPSVTFQVMESFTCQGQLVDRVLSDDFDLQVPQDGPVSLHYPWINHRSDLEQEPTSPSDRAVRFLKMFMMLVRRHGHKGRAAVFDKKLEGRQSYQGEHFKAAVAAMVQLGVVEYDGDMIHLQPDWEKYRFSPAGRQGQTSLDDRIDTWRPVLLKIEELAG